MLESRLESEPNIKEEFDQDLASYEAKKRSEAVQKVAKPSRKRIEAHQSHGKPVGVIEMESYDEKSAVKAGTELNSNRQLVTLQRLIIT